MQDNIMLNEYYLDKIFKSVTINYIDSFHKLIIYTHINNINNSIILLYLIFRLYASIYRIQYGYIGIHVHCGANPLSKMRTPHLRMVGSPISVPRMHLDFLLVCMVMSMMGQSDPPVCHF